MKNLVICGDSYNIGIGCRDLKNEPYGSLLSKKLNLNELNFAKGSSTNLSIHLQAKYAVDNVKNIEFLILAVTSYGRIEWYSDDTMFSANDYEDVKNTDINYHTYAPYSITAYPYVIDNPMKDDEGYKGNIFTENFCGIDDYVDNYLEKGNPHGYPRFKNENKDRIRLLKEYFKFIYDARLKRINDIGVITMSHNLLKNNGIKHIILCHDVDGFAPYVSQENLCFIDWGYLSTTFPDDLPSLHTSPEGHVEVFKILIKKLKENKWINDDIDENPNEIIKKVI